LYSKEPAWSLANDDHRWLQVLDGPKLRETREFLCYRW
jgi:hypothetical protein